MAHSTTMMLAFALSTLLLGASADDTFFLKPLADKAGPEVCVMIIQGASSPPEGYRPLAEAIQKASPMPVWVGVPQYIQNLPEPAQFGSKLSDTLKQMTAAGMRANRTVLLAHSLGGVMSQLHLAGTDNQGIDALILYGSTILRKYRTANGGASLAVPVLTLDGDLDGLLRVTRQAEAFFHQVTQAGFTYPTSWAAAFTEATTLPRNPVVLLEGLTHWSVSSGPVPSNVKSNDLTPEVTEDEGHTAIAATVADYIVATGTSSSSSGAAAAVASLSSKLARTEALVAPLIRGLEQEGSSHLHTACNSDFPTNPTCGYAKYPNTGVFPKGPPSPMPPTDCTCGSPWVMSTAQRLVGGLDWSPAAGRAEVVTRDAFHDVSDVRPFHLPHVFYPAPGKSCDDVMATADAGTVCTLNTTTVTMPVQDFKDTSLDTGLYPIAATELRTKLKSRQAVWQKAGLLNASFDALDAKNTSVCREVNAAAYAWALSQASPAALKRFARVGQSLTFAPDVFEGIGITGPKWIKSPLSFTPAADGKTVAVAAPTFATANKNLGDASFVSTVGFHYCKLLSPGRALEWIYIDGLKAHGGIKAQQQQQQQQQQQPAPVLAETLLAMPPPQEEEEEQQAEETTTSKGGCVDLASLRSASVLSSSFDLSRVSGTWYEVGVTDVAQVGASCQTITNTVNGSSASLTQAFSVKYGIIPFKQTYEYAPGSSSTQGVFNKYLVGAKSLLTLPTVIVSVGAGTAAQRFRGATYETLIEYTCKSVIGATGLHVEELRLLSRTKAVASAELARMKQVALDAGVPSTTVAKIAAANDYSKCK